MYGAGFGQRGGMGFSGFKPIAEPEPSTYIGKIRKYYRSIDSKTIKLLQHTVMFLGSVFIINKYGHILDQPLPNGAELHNLSFPAQAVAPQYQTPQQTQQGY